MRRAVHFINTRTTNASLNISLVSTCFGVVQRFTLLLFMFSCLCCWCWCCCCCCCCCFVNIGNFSSCCVNVDLLRIALLRFDIFSWVVVAGVICDGIIYCWCWILLQVCLSSFNNVCCNHRYSTFKWKKGAGAVQEFVVFLELVQSIFYFVIFVFQFKYLLFCKRKIRFTLYWSWRTKYAEEVYQIDEILYTNS